MHPIRHLAAATVLGVLLAAAPASADRIAFTSFDQPFPEGIGGTDANIWTIDPDTGAAAPLTDDPANDREPAWSPDGATIAFTSARSGNGDIYVVPAGGGAQVALTGTAAEDTQPQWSPGGTRIAFIRTTGVGSSLWTMARDGTQARRVNGTGYGISAPRWSPDGREIAYERRGTSTTTVWTIRPDGRHRERIAEGTAPAWSPDGRMLALGGPVHVAGGGPLVVARTRGNPKPRTITAIAGGQPDWLPDGEQLVYVHNTGGDAESQLRRVRADGTGDVALTPGPGWSPAGPGDVTPDVSPDGGRVAFVSGSTEPFDDIALVSTAGGDPRLLGRDQLSDGDPVWQPAPQARRRR